MSKAAAQQPADAVALAAEQIYQQIHVLVQQRKVDTALIIELASDALSVASTFKKLSDSQKKAAIISAMTTLVNDAPLNEAEKAAALVCVNTVLPGVVANLIAADARENLMLNGRGCCWA